MARPLRIEYPGAIYHVMSRGNQRRAIFDDDGDYQRLLQGLEQSVGRFGWELLSFALMPNHFHLLLRTPRPTLSRGMQYLVSGYANWYAKRHRRPGHLMQGRFKAALIEDETYFWSVRRYVHLNPVIGKRPLVVTHPADWPWSSYPEYARKRARVQWVAYKPINQAWRGEMGGNNPERAYCRFVEQGLTSKPEDPFRRAGVAGCWEVLVFSSGSEPQSRHRNILNTCQRRAESWARTTMWSLRLWPGILGFLPIASGRSGAG